jgi:hypothetical protein
MKTTMKLESLSIELKNSYSKPSPENPYIAKLRISYDNTTMQVKLNDETCRRILALAGDEIAQAAQVQIQDFVRTAIAVNEAPAIEGKAQ